MIITCGQCQAKFKVAPEQIKESGSKVRCSNCQYVFTVFRPDPPRESAADPLDDFLNTMGARQERPGDDLDKSLARLLEAADDDADNYRARRERRRRLYSDLEDEPGRASFDDSLENLEEDDAPHPPLRRAGRPKSEADENLAAAATLLPEEEDELPPPLEERHKTPLGLEADPSRQQAPAAPTEGRAAASLRAAAEPGKNPRLLLVLAIVGTALLAGLYFMANRPEPTALSTGDQPAAQAPGTGAAANTGPENTDPGGTLGITFSKNNQNHYFRDNVKEGKILIITGMVRNSYPEPRSFIHLRGRLVSADNATLADRYAYAGNLVSEEELISLPIREIFARLSITAGQNGQNMNVEPGREVPFMLVFDKLPDGMTEYRIDPMGSSPAE